MVVFVGGLQDIAVIAPGGSLILQLAEWSEGHRGFALRLIPSLVGCGLQEVWEAACFSIVDATIHPREALYAMEQALRAVGRERIAVYSEVMHEGLEDRVRTEGVFLWLGPMPPEEWGAAFRALEAAARGSSAGLSSFRGRSVSGGLRDYPMT